MELSEKEEPILIVSRFNMVAKKTQEELVLDLKMPLLIHRA